MLKLSENKLYPIVSISKEELVEKIMEIFGCDDKTLVKEFVKTLSDEDMQKLTNQMSSIIGERINITEIICDIMCDNDFYRKIPDEIKN